MKRKVVGGSVTAGVALIALVILLVLFVPRTEVFRKTFKKKCEKFPEESKRCEDMLKTFEEAYVGKGPRQFPEKNYDLFLNNNPFTHPNSRTMLWSNIKGLVHKYTASTGGCLFTLEDTLVGSILDGLSWCGLEGRQDTFDLICKIDPKNNPVISFWRNISARFAAYAAGEVTAMLNGGKGDPYDANSVFALEVKNLRPNIVTRLSVVLVTDNPARCEHDSLQTLKQEVTGKGISYSCTPVKRSRIKECIDKNLCGSCW